MSKAPNNGIQFRARTEAPTVPGWYYGRQKRDEFIQPVYVFVPDDDKPNDLGVDCDDDEIGALGEFDWFGPVPTCVESGT